MGSADMKAFIGSVEGQLGQLDAGSSEFRLFTLHRELADLDCMTAVCLYNVCLFFLSPTYQS